LRRLRNGLLDRARTARATRLWTFATAWHVPSVFNLAFDFRFGWSGRYEDIGCHQGINIGGNLLQRFGIARNYV